MTINKIVYYRSRGDDMMFKTVINKSRTETIYLEYDKEKYDIEYVSNRNTIILRRLIDNKVVEIFSDKVGFIVQCNAFGKTHFLATTYTQIDQRGLEVITLKHYIDEPLSDSLILQQQFACNSIQLDECRITDNSFMVEQLGYGGSIYNLSQKTKKFVYVYNDKKINKIVGDNVLMVSERKSACSDNDVNDTITYGINPVTFEIVTPIWSRLQQRFIEIYTEEQINQMNGGTNINIEKPNLGDITIYFEIERYLNYISMHLNTKQEMYLDCMDKVNESFVKKFVKE